MVATLRVVGQEPVNDIGWPFADRSPLMALTGFLTGSAIDQRPIQTNRPPTRSGGGSGGVGISGLNLWVQNTEFLIARYRAEVCSWLSRGLLVTDHTSLRY